MTPEEYGADVLRRCWADRTKEPDVQFEGIDVEVANAVKKAVADERIACAKDAKILMLEVGGTPVPADQMHLYAIRFVQVPGSEPSMSLYRNGCRIASAWSLKADASFEATSCTAPG